MAMDMNKGKVVESHSLIITPKGRMYYPSLFEKSFMKDDREKTKGKWQLRLLLPKTADLTIIKAEMNRAIVEKFGAAPAKGYNFKVKNWCFDKTSESPKLADYADEYPYILSAKAHTQQPDVAYASKKKCEDPAESYGGRWAALSIQAFAYKHDTGGAGVSFSLSHVMLLDHDDPIGSARARMEDVFEGVGDDAEGGAPESAAALFD